MTEENKNVESVQPEPIKEEKPKKESHLKKENDLLKEQNEVLKKMVEDLKNESLIAKADLVNYRKRN